LLLDECQRYILERYGKIAAEVFKAVYLLQGQPKVPTEAEKMGGSNPSETFSLRQIVEKTRSLLYEDKNLDVHFVKQKLLQPSMQQTINLLITGEDAMIESLSSDCFYLSLSQCFNVIRRRMIESIIHEKFDAKSVRLYRVTLQDKFVEQKQLMEKCMLTRKEILERGYKMFIAGFLILQEVPKTSEKAPANTIYLWHVDPQATIRACMRDIHKTMYNVMSYFKSTREETLRCLTFPPVSDCYVFASKLLAGADALSEGDKEVLQNLERCETMHLTVLTTLDYTLCQLDACGVRFEVPRRPDLAFAAQSRSIEV